mgnify:CR=1 FL=1
MDRIILNNVGIPEFDRSVTQEMFEQTPKNNDEQVEIKTFIGTILKAHVALEKHIDSLKLRYENAGKNKENRMDILGELFQYY